jgi:hypothetical protein
MNDNNAAAAGPEDRWRLIARDIPRGEGEADFVVGEDEIRAILAAGRDPNLYWGTGACPCALRFRSHTFPPQPPRELLTWATLCPSSRLVTSSTPAATLPSSLPISTAFWTT